MNKKLMYSFAFMLLSYNALYCMKLDPQFIDEVLENATKDQEEFNTYWSSILYPLPTSEHLARLKAFYEDKKTNNIVTCKRQIKEGLWNCLPCSFYTLVTLTGFMWAYKVYHNDNFTVKSIAAALGTTFYGMYNAKKTAQQAFKGIHSIWNGYFYATYVKTMSDKIEATQAKINNYPKNQ